MAWLSGWSYRKEITITGQSGAGTNYQVLLDIGDSAGGDFHLEGNCTNFPEDIEVTDNDGTTLLKFWIPDKTADPLEMWVKVADDLGSNQTIYVYYGKSGATTNSNGANTFLQYHGSASSNFIETPQSTINNIIYEGIVRTGTDTSNVGFGVGDTLKDNPDDSLSGKIGILATDTTYFITYNEGAGEYQNTSGLHHENIYYRLRIERHGTTAEMYVDDVQFMASTSTNMPDENIGLFMFIATGSGDQKWSVIRKYNSPEPAFSSAGSEETPPTGVTIPVLMHHYSQMMRA